MKSKEQVLDDILGYSKECPILAKEDALKAMEEYAQQFASQPHAPVGKLWEEVPVKEGFPPIDKSEKDWEVLEWSETVWVKTSDDVSHAFYAYREKLWYSEGEPLSNVTNWLRPVTFLQGGYSLEQVAAAAYQAGSNRSWGETYNEFHPEDQVEIKSPTFEKFIQSLNKK